MDKSLQQFYHSAGETNGSVLGNEVFVAFLKDMGDIGRSPIIREVTGRLAFQLGVDSKLTW